MNAHNLTAPHIDTPINRLQTSIHEAFAKTGDAAQDHARQRYQVILAGNHFFHIREAATGRVRGFRADHNEACALARNLEAGH